MKLEEINYDNKKTGCCALLKPEEWDDRVVRWQDKPFVIDHIRSVFHIPLNFGKVAMRVHNKLREAEAFTDPPLWLSDERSMWRSDYMAAIDKEVPDTNTVTLSGTFYTKVFEGPYNNVEKWEKEIREHLAKKGEKVEKVYFYYSTCPRCAKTFGYNYVVLFAKVA